MTNSTCSRCGTAFAPKEYTTGYATIPDGSRICYRCADTQQREEMQTAQHYFAYLSSDGQYLTTWTGGVLATVTSETQDSGTGWHGTRLTHIRAVAPDGSLWYGKGAGRGMCLLIHRSKAKTPERKTRDEWVVQGNYGQGWEDVTADDTWTAGRTSLREYRENETSYAHRLVCRRVRKEANA